MPHPVLSDFGNFIVENGQKAMEMHYVMRDTYNPESNLWGIVNLGVAENTLMHESLKGYFQNAFRLRDLDFTYGDGLSGTKRLTKALVDFLNTYFNPCREVKAEHLLLGCGLITMIGQVGRAVANRGDGILVVAPYYSGFDASFAVEHGLKPVEVRVEIRDVGTMKEIEALEEARWKSEANGTKVRAVLLCNPHNPLGRCYERPVLEAYGRFCERHNLHLISDEIFAMSVYPSQDFPIPPPFVSVLALDLERINVNPARVHCLYGMSKDFNANGFRAGLLVSQHNEGLINCLTTTNMFSVVASPSDALWSALLNDTKILANFFIMNRSKLTEAYEYVTGWLRYQNLPYIPAHAAHFLMVDMRSVLENVVKYGALLGIKVGDEMGKREVALVDYLRVKKVHLSPGSDHHYSERGWIRLSFSVRRDYLNVGLRRIEEALGWSRWPEMKELKSLGGCGEVGSTLKCFTGSHLLTRLGYLGQLGKRMEDFSLISLLPCHHPKNPVESKEENQKIF
ncbi:pyridoxal phosphate-dependent transferase [Collybia nuda]|uniref:Pyridoxal phosphate-dependent transferase n=1 Tax=Collybia nuda TaxID=64659 RepID=A0A9P5XUK0_9AGAR|nr:pyridoxal phosphate-dependent transferase [Collybia nuda]